MGPFLCEILCMVTTRNLSIGLWTSHIYGTDVCSSRTLSNQQFCFVPYRLIRQYVLINKQTHK